MSPQLPSSGSVWDGGHDCNLCRRQKGKGAKASLDSSLVPARSILAHTADRHTQTPAGTAGQAHQCEGGVQRGDHHVSNSQVDDEEVGGRVHPLVLDDHVAHQDVAKE